MNIFCLDSDPIKAARFLDDKRCINQVKETAQILSTALYNLGYWASNLYQPTHRHHPCIRWAGKSRGNFDWLVLHGLALNEEYKHRFGNGLSHGHKSTEVILNCVQRFKDCKLDSLGMTAFTNCTNISGNIGVVKLYRLYMIQTKWSNPLSKPKWTKRGPPSWYKNVS
jgi:hypothetical protein